MSKQQAILETLLGAAELNGNQTLIARLRTELEKVDIRRQLVGYQRFAMAAGESRQIRSKAA
jgi:hypothetical protein